MGELLDDFDRLSTKTKFFLFAVLILVVAGIYIKFIMTPEEQSALFRTIFIWVFIIVVLFVGIIYPLLRKDEPRRMSLEAERAYERRRGERIADRDYRDGRY